MNRKNLSTYLETAHVKAAVGVTTITTITCLVFGTTLGQTILAILAVISAQFSIGFSNNYFDRENDKKSGRKDKAIVNKVLRAKTVLIIATLLLAISVVLSLSLDIRAGLIHLGAVAIAWSYNIGLKNTRLSILCYMAAFSIIPLFAAELAGNTASLLTVLSFAALGSTMHLLDALGDYEYDNKAGINGFPNSFPLATSELILKFSAVVFMVLSTSNIVAITI